MRKTNIDFIKKRFIWYGISAIIIIIGIISFAIQGLNQGIDFTGGNRISVQFTQEVALEDLRATVSETIDSTPTIQAAENNIFTIRTMDDGEDSNTTLIETLSNTYGEMTVLENERIGPTVGQELLNNAKWALIIAFILMLIYITIRFKLRFALAAVVPLFHDILIMTCLFSIFQIEVDTNYIAAILTILGFSINGTIIIFDRIRENTPKHQNFIGKDLINQSINQTLGRTINTVVAVMILVICLYLFGGDSTKNFALALIFGMVAGGYSSICIAGSILFDLMKIGNPKTAKAHK